MPLQIDQQLEEIMQRRREQQKREYEQHVDSHGDDRPTVRRALLHVAPDCFAYMTSGCFKVIANPMPADAQIVGAFYNHQRNAFGLVLESAEFEPRKLGNVLPELTGPYIMNLAANVEEIDKLRAIALAAQSLLKVHYEFDGNPSCIGQYIEALDAALEKIGDERLSEMKYGG